jgi:pimeloyl-ACP methyl ester carboxylesterase
MSILKSLHWAAAQAMKQAGYRWEPRRAGDLKIGVWRKRWRTTTSARRFVFIPGFGDTPLSWGFVLPLLSPVLRKRYDEIVLVDFPGFGGFLSSEKPYHSVDLMTEALFDTLDSLRPTTILGHSLGGAFAALYAADCGAGLRPTKQQAGLKSPYAGPDTLILVTPSGVFPSDEERDELTRKFTQAVEAKMDGIEKVRPHMFAKEPFWFRFFAGEFSKFFATTEIEQFIASFKTPDILRDKASHIRCKVWLIWGDKDTLIPPTCLPAWLEKLDDRAQGILLKNVGHSPQIEATTTLATILNAILSEDGKFSQILKYPLASRWWTLYKPTPVTTSS